MVRKLALAVSLALGTLSVPVHALGLGELSSKSTLNQNFQGEIALLSVKADELDTVRVKLADQEAFSRAGVDRPFYLSLLKFEPILSPRGKPVVRVTSEFPIREPFLNFLIEVNWPNGRLLREYTVLLDPPTTTRRRPPVIAPPAQQPAAAPRRAAPPPARTAAPAPTRAAPAASGAAFAGGEYGPVQANDTAWGIAKKVRPRGVSMEQMMMALLNANPQAFIRNDINRLRQGRILRVPALAEIQQMSRADARAAYREQQDAWLARRDARLQAAAQQKAAAEAPAADATAADPAPDQLRIATARPEGSGEAGAGDDDAVSATASDLKSRLIAARENAETSRQEAETLRSRVDDLQARLQDMQRLLSLKDEQLAQLQDNVATAEAGPDAGDGEAVAALPLPEADAPVDDVILANQVDPDAIVEQAARQAMETAADSAPVADADAPAAVIDEVVIEGAPTAETDVAQAIDDAVADLVGSAESVAADYRIEDIAPQIDPDRIVAGTTEGVAPDATAVAAAAVPLGELEIPVQVDPDRIVLGLDATQDAAGSDAAAVATGTSADVATMAGAELVIEGAADSAAVAAEPAPAAPEVALAPAPEPPPAVEPAAPTASGGAGLIPPALAATVEKNIVPIAAGGVALLGLLGWLFTRGRRKDETDEALLATAGAPAAAAAEDAVADAADEAVDEPILNAESLEDLPDSAFLDDFSPSDINALQDETGEVDPVSEADVYIAYGRYQQAEELLRQAMERDPDRLALKHKLLEVHYATRDADAYAALAQEMVEAGQDAVDEEAWARAQDMGRELAPDNTLFAVAEGSATWRAAAAGAAGGAVASAASTVDTDTLSLDDVEMSELTAAYDDGATAANDLEAPSEVSITLDLDDASDLASATPPEPEAPEPASLDNLEPLEFELPDADSHAAPGDTVDEDSITETLDLDSMMAEAEAAVDQDKSELSLDSDFSAAELQAQLDELSDLSALDSELEGGPSLQVAEPTDDIGLVAEDAGAVEASLDEPMSLDMAFDSDVGGEDSLDTLELDDPDSEGDEVATKLDLARAYVEMGDDDGARSILEEVVTEGDDGQRGEAEKILAQLG